MSDLISRSALIERLKREWEMQDLYLPVHFIDFVEDAPTVDAVPVVRGEWVCLEAEIGLFECSECEHKILRAECNYCPNCGADMRKKVE